MALQKALRIKADGSFGPVTEAAVKARAEGRKLTQTGVVGTAHLEGRRGADAALTPSRECGQRSAGVSRRARPAATAGRRSAACAVTPSASSRAAQHVGVGSPRVSTSDPSAAQHARASRRNAAVSVVAVCTRCGAGRGRHQVVVRRRAGRRARRAGSSGGRLVPRVEDVAVRRQLAGLVDDHPAGTGPAPTGPGPRG